MFNGTDARCCFPSFMSFCNSVLHNESCVQWNFYLHAVGCISSACACTSPVFADSVVPFKSFRTVPGSSRCEGAHKKVLRKTAPLSGVLRSSHPYGTAHDGHLEWLYEQLRGIRGVETCIYIAAGKSNSTPCSCRAASLENLPEVSLGLITRWNVGT